MKQSTLPLQYQESFDNLNLPAEGDKNWLWLSAPTSDEAKVCEITFSNTSNNDVVAKVIVSAASDNSLEKRTNFHPAQLTQAAYINGVWLKSNDNQDLLPLVLYFALRRARIWRVEDVIVEQVPATVNDILQLESLAAVNSDNRCYAQELSYAIFNAYQTCSAEQKQLINQELTNETMEMLHNWLADFYNGSWAQSIFNQTISKQQYIFSLCNMHQFVRYTTRLVARSVAYSDDPIIRDHWLYHLQGEINHERIIERDLAYLGYDVDYLKDYQVPHWSVKRFTVGQDSIIGYHADPVNMLANPFIAEGMTAHIKPEFMSALNSSIAKWGYDDPSQGSNFLSSHIHTDGGEDGHWNHVVKMITHYINDEVSQQRFHSVMRCAMEGYLKGFDATVDSHLLWSDPNLFQ